MFAPVVTVRYPEVIPLCPAAQSERSECKSGPLRNCIHSFNSPHCGQQKAPPPEKIDEDGVKLLRAGSNRLPIDRADLVHAGKRIREVGGDPNHGDQFDQADDDRGDGDVLPGLIWAA